MMGLGVVAIILGFMDDSNRALANLLVNNFFFLALGLFGVFFIMYQYLTESGWPTVVKRVFEAMSQYLIVGGPILFVLILVLLFGHSNVYHWTHAELYDPSSGEFDHILANKSAYLNTSFFLVRTLVYLVGWIYFAHILRKYSLLEDETAGLTYHKKSHGKSAWFAVFFAVTTTTSAWDWLMSVDPHWFSTLYGWYTMIGMWVSGTTFALLWIIHLKRKGYFKEVNASHLHDLGKWMFAISMVWTYLFVSQFLLIWYAGIPEETTYFVFRFAEYKVLFVGMLLINFVLPFFLLMARDSKRNTKVLVIVGSIIFMGHWTDVYVMVLPGATGEATTFVDFLLSLCMFVGFLGLFLFVVQKALAKAPLIPKNHPFLDESLNHNY